MGNKKLALFCLCAFFQVACALGPATSLEKQAHAHDEKKNEDSKTGLSEKHYYSWSEEGKNYEIYLRPNFLALFHSAQEKTKRPQLKKEFGHSSKKTATSITKRVHLLVEKHFKKIKDFKNVFPL